jgi:hypothetical protein
LNVQVVGNLAYVADGAAGLQILDVSKPAAPVRLGGYDTPGVARGVQVVGNLAYVANSAGLQFLDVSKPSAPVRLGGCDTPDVFGVQVVGNLAYVAYGDGLLVLSLVDPIITVQPQPVTITAGQTAQFTVTAAGTAPLAYQWQRNGTDLPGATAATLSVVNAQSANAGSYRVIVSNAAASYRMIVSHTAGSATSTAATLTVNVPPP